MYSSAVSFTTLFSSVNRRLEREATVDAAKRKLREQAQKEGKNMSEQALENAAKALEFAKEQGEFDWTMLDPTDVGEVVKAFYKPVCGEKLPPLFPGAPR